MCMASPAFRNRPAPQRNTPQGNQRQRGVLPRIEKRLMMRIHRMYLKPDTPGINSENCAAILEHVLEQPHQTWEVWTLMSLTNIIPEIIAGLTGKTYERMIATDQINIITIKFVRRRS